MKQVYRIESNRLKGYDYSSPNGYFVTFRIKNKNIPLSEITNDGHIKLSIPGEILEQEWLKIPVVRNNIRLGEYAIMPDHFHGIIIIKGEKIKKKNSITPFRKLLPNTLGSIINHFKGNTTKRSRVAGYNDFIWEKNFYESIFSTMESLESIEKYIRNNPIKWREKYFDSMR